MKLSTVVRFATGSISLAIVILAGVITVPASAVENGGIGGRPANPDPNNPRTESIFIYQLEPSAQKTDEVLIMNNTDQQQVINLYAVDGILTNTGAYACEQAVEQKNSVGAWLQFDQTQVSLSPGTSTKVPFTVTMPEKVDVGEHNGCVVFQSANDEGEVQNNVRVRTRQAIRMAITVPGELKKDVAIKSFSTDRVNALQQFMVSVANKGNVSADVDVRVTLKSFWGASVYENTGGYPVLANTSLDLNYVNESSPFWGGWYVAQAEINYDSRPGTFNVVNSEHKVSEVSQSIVVFSTPHRLAFAIYWTVFLALLVWGYIYLRRLRERKLAGTWEDYKVKKSDTIATIADQRQVSWTLLVRENKLKKPYILQPGSSIRIPALPQGPETEPGKKKNTPTKKPR